MSKFAVGSVFKTCGIEIAMDEDKKYIDEIVDCLSRYLAGDWGNLSEDDKIANDKALTNNERLLGAYQTSKGKVYIITEWDRKITTILFAHEY